jgi:hypothetical protein
MRADVWFRQYWSFAFPLPFFRLRYVFATPSDHLRDRPGKALGLRKLRSDSPLDSVHVGRSYLGAIGASNGSGTLGSLSVSDVVLANSLLGLLFDTDSSAQALVLDRIVDCRPERWDNQLSTNAGSTTSHNRSYSMCVGKRVCFWNVLCDSNQLETGSHSRTIRQR